MKTSQSSHWNGSVSPALREAAWIGLKSGDPTQAAPCPYLRKSFNLPGPVRSATLEWTALGLAELWINGRRVGDRVFEPGWSDYRKRAQVMRVEVAEYLRPGSNTIGAVLGDGWFCGALTWLGKRNCYGDYARFLADLDVTLDNGTRQRVATDDSWEAATGPILESDLYHGETYDARLELSGWCDAVPSAQTPGGWRPVDVFPDYEGILQLKRNEPMRVTEELSSVSITPRGEGSWIVDFGQNLVGFCRLRIANTSPGQSITLRFAEMLKPDGSLYTENLRTARATDTYICRGGEVEEWTPRFTFHGFRYAEIVGLKDAPDTDTLRALVVHSDMRPTGRFECSNPDINRLNQNIRWGMRGNFLDVPTDCPQRDERLGWTGDAQIFVGTAAFHFDVRRFFEKWMFDLTDGQSDDGAFPDVAPDVLTPLMPSFRGNAAWGDAGVIVPWKIYWHYGNRTILEENYQAMSRWIDFQEKTSRDLLRPSTTYGDWLAVDAVAPQRAPTPSDLIGTAYFAETARIMSRVAATLGRKSDAQRFRKLSAGVARAFRREYVTAGGRIVGDCQTAYALALMFNLLTPEQEAVAVRRLIELIEAANWHLTTGFVGTPLLCPALSRHGRTDIAYKLLLQDTYPSWLDTVRNGATTMWERWDSYTKERGFGPAGMNSFNHYAYGAVGEWLYSVVGGIRCLKPGFREILIAPEPGEGISFARTELDTVSGKIICEWLLEGECVRITADIPKKIKAQLLLPPGFVAVGAVPGRLPPGRLSIEARRN